MGKQKSVWYLAYGSNMKRSVLESRGGGISILAARRVQVPGYMLTFDVFGLPYSEPSMASIAKFVLNSPASSYERSEIIAPVVHGIAYQLSATDYRRLVGSEGGGVAYDEVKVLAEDLSGGTSEKLTVHTLVAKYPWRPNAAPSERYVVCQPTSAPKGALADVGRACYEMEPRSMICLRSIGHGSSHCRVISQRHRGGPLLARQSSCRWDEKWCAFWQ